MIHFTTIIPTRDRADLLPRSLDSALAQSHQAHEIIVIDAGSTDATSRVLERYEGRIRALNVGDCGPGAARNAGIKVARGDYITFLDSDDLWFPWTLKTFQRAIEEAGQPSFIAGTHVDFASDADPLPSAAAPFCIRRYADYLSTSRESVWIGTPAVAIRTETLRALDGFTRDHVNAEDSDLWLRLGIADNFVHLTSPPVFAYRRHPGTAISALDRPYRGILRLVIQERTGRYPGGGERRWDRRRIILRHLRPASLACLRAGCRAEGWHLFRESLAWHIRLFRIKYLIGFPFVAAACLRRNSPAPSLGSSECA